MKSALMVTLEGSKAWCPIASKRPFSGNEEGRLGETWVFVCGSGYGETRDRGEEMEDAGCAEVRRWHVRR
jgi:hypothetical protein